MKFKMFTALILFLPLMNINSQEQIKIMTYNLLNYDGSDTTTRNPYFRTIVSSINPDILVVEEIYSRSPVAGFLNNVMNTFGEVYDTAAFVDGYDSDNALFFKPSKITFLSNRAIKTALRDISEFRVKNNSTGDTLIIYAAHLKSSSGADNELLRAAEVDSLRKVTNQLPAGSNFIVLGDFNIYKSTEAAYQKLLNQTNSGYFVDQLNMTGTWNNSAYASYHTQSTRTRSFGYGATGGLDDRFDMILVSQAMYDSGGITLLPSTYTPYGNDGGHYNDSINHSPNNAVGQTIANALHYASDHLPVFASFSFEPTDMSITLHLTALIEGFYNGIFMIPDTVNVYLHQTVPPYASVDSAKIRLDSLGFGAAKFYNAPSGIYYIGITHRSSIETWSRVGGEQFVKGQTMIYDFTTGQDKAYGGNLKPK